MTKRSSTIGCGLALAAAFALLPALQFGPLSLAASDENQAADVEKLSPKAESSTISKPDDKPLKSAKSGKAATPGFTPEREAAALTFVRQHHAELADLLVRLKERRPQEYQKAIRDLFRVSERLAQSNEQQPRRYDLELKEWKLQSRIQLLVARITMSSTAELERELRQLLGEQLDVRRELLALNHERAAARAQSLADELKQVENRRSELLQQNYEKALNSAGQKKQALKAARDSAETKATASPTAAVKP